MLGLERKEARKEGNESPMRADVSTGTRLGYLEVVCLSQCGESGYEPGLHIPSKWLTERVALNPKQVSSAKLHHSRSETWPLMYYIQAGGPFLLGRVNNRVHTFPTGGVGADF